VRTALVLEEEEAVMMIIAEDISGDSGGGVG